ncbi:hypothetical protein TSUD_199170 [Trifolium subterraneum]|uniref:Uncharacterized protein n=1 Tax=Trifolium subterraneum TaxID=3900 RepID=A0A2Z6LR75_TRISU|nr:hypothetical protein TSUD_199170 [Trifolium subterraneum]
MRTEKELFERTFAYIHSPCGIKAGRIGRLQMGLVQSREEEEDQDQSLATPLKSFPSFLAVFFVLPPGRGIPFALARFHSKADAALLTE